MITEYPRTLTLNRAEAWNLLEIYEETIRSGDYATLDTLEQKLIDMVYGTPKEQEADRLAGGSDGESEGGCGDPTCCPDSYPDLIIDGGAREDTT